MLQKEIIMKESFEILKKTSLFKNITDFEFKNILEEIKVYTKNYDTGSVILLQDEPYDELYIITKGNCVGEMIDYSGKTITIEEFKSPYILATGILFAEKNRLPVSVIAKNKTTVLIISKNDILKLCRSSKIFLQNFLKDISDKLIFISQKISFFKFTTIKEKLANYILNLPKAPDDSFELTSSIEELSNLFGVSRPSLSRVFAELENDGIILKNNKKIKIIDNKKFTKFE